MVNSLLRLLTPLLEIGAVLVLALSVVGFFADQHVLAAILGSFRLQYTAFLFFAAGVLLVRSQRRFILAVVPLGLILNAIAFWPVLTDGVGTSDPLPDRATYRVVSTNLLGKNTDYERTIDDLRDSDADFVVLIELRPEWWVHIQKELGKDYSHQLTEPLDNNFGIGLISRHPWQSAEIFRESPGAPPFVEAQFSLPDGQLQLVGIHPYPTISSAAMAERSAQLATVADRVNTRPESAQALVIGDFNTVPWAPAFRQFLQDTGTRHPGSRSLWPTWYRIRQLQLFPDGVPIDHATLTPGLRLLDHQVWPSTGSDHRPLVIDFQVAEG